jgi:hypothetical protein
MAIAVIGGVITSTFLTLLVVPVVFAGMEKLRLRRRPDRTQAPPSAPVEQAPASTSKAA